MPVGNGFVEVGPHRLECAFFGDPGPGPTLVFLHEGLGSVSLWRDFPGRAAEATGLRAFAYSRRGYGRSSGYPPPWPVEYMHEEARLLPQVLAAAGVGASILVGHSDGASIALLHAGSREPQGLRGLVLLSPHVFAEEVGLRSIERIRDEYRASDGLRSRLARHHQDPDNAFWGWNTGWLHPDFRRWNIESSLPEVRVPALLIQGDADEYGTLAHVESIARQSSGHAETLLLPGSGHSPHRDKPDEVLAGIARFVRQLVPS